MTLSKWQKWIQSQVCVQILVLNPVFSSSKWQQILGWSYKGWDWSQRSLGIWMVRGGGGHDTGAREWKESKRFQTAFINKGSWGQRELGGGKKQIWDLLLLQFPSHPGGDIYQAVDNVEPKCWRVSRVKDAFGNSLFIIDFLLRPTCLRYLILVSSLPSSSDGPLSLFLNYEKPQTWWLTGPFVCML